MGPQPLGLQANKIYWSGGILEFPTEQSAEAAFNGMYALARFLGKVHPDWLKIAPATNSADDPVA